MDRREFMTLAAVSPGLAALSQQPRRSAQTPFTFYSPLAEDWHQGGQFFDWKSTTANNAGRSVRVFYRTFGNRSNPAIVLIHGYYRMSYDFRDMIQLLQNDYFLCVLDFPGFGFSDKPQDGYSYMLRDDAKLVDYYVREIVGLTRFHILAHDRGNSVTFALLGDYLESPRRNYEITYHFMMNGGIFLPLANLSQGQRDLLDPVKGPAAIAQARTRPRVTTGTPRQVAEADGTAFNDGTGAQLYVGKYQLERAANEYRWLANLQQSPVPTALLWGLTDTVNPPRMAHYVWATYLHERAVESSFWILPTAGHTLHVDQPDQVANVVRVCLNGRIPTREGESAFMNQIARERSSPDSPVYIGRSHIEPVTFPGAVQYSPAGYHS
jgi:pimeloyl-ACP methyl ester carboxylesterase